MTEVSADMTKTTTAIKARKNLGQLLEEAYYRGDEFVIERAGKPMAVLIPIQEFRRWQEQREADFALFDDVRAKAKKASPGEVEEEVGKAIARVRKNA